MDIADLVHAVIGASPSAEEWHPHRFESAERTHRTETL
jgi:hypothetical protein